jgi:hypothetical protein
MSAHTCAPADYVQMNLSAATCSGRQVLALEQEQSQLLAITNGHVIISLHYS